MKLLKCYGGKDVKIDDFVYEIVSQYMWYPKGDHVIHHFYQKDVDQLRIKYQISYIKPTTYHLGRFIWILVNQAQIPDTLEVDHIDRDPSNNQIQNLRLATRKQNAMNKDKVLKSNDINLEKKEASKYKGVSKVTHQRRNKQGEITSSKDYWRMRIKNPLTGQYECTCFPYTSQGELEAAKAYDKKAIEYYGLFGKLNFQNSGEEELKNFIFKHLLIVDTNDTLLSFKIEKSQIKQVYSTEDDLIVTLPFELIKEEEKK